MRRLVVLLVLLGVMLGLDALKAQPVVGKNPMTLAAIGFVLLAAYTVAELLSLFKAPRVTGYILSGIVLGPSVADILSSAVVKDMRMFNTLALGLIAVGAGLELDVREMRKILRTLLTTIAIKVAIGAVLVGGVFYAVEKSLGLVGLEDHGKIVALALVLGAISIGTSPAISLAVKNETRAKGRLMDLVLGAAVLKDVVMVVSLAVAIAISRPLIGVADGGESPLMLVARELGSSLAAGAVLGVLLILYIRFVKAEMLLFVAAMILVVSEVGKALHLELLLVFIVAGFVVRNFSKYEHELMPAVEMVALPVFVVFFTIAGAGVDLRASWQVLPVAAGLCAVRAFAYVLSARVGGRVGRESDYVRKNAWLGYLPQAGVTLGLVGLAANQLPAVSDHVMTMGMAVVALNLLIGPVTLRRALQGAGEIPKEEEETAAAQPGLAPREETGDDEEVVEAPDFDARLDEMLKRMQAPALEPLVRELAADLHRVAKRFANRQVRPWQRAFGQSAALALEGDDEERFERLEAWAERSHSDDFSERAEACRELFRELRQTLRRCPEEVEVPLEDRNRKVEAGDAFRVRLRKRRAALARVLSFGRRKAVRHVPVRVLVRIALEPRMAGVASELLGSWCRAQAGVYEEIRRLASGVQDVAETRAAADRRLQLLTERLEADVAHALLAGLDALALPLGRAGGPALPHRNIRLSEIDDDVRDALRRLDKEAEGWQRALEADRGTLALKVELASIEVWLGRSLERAVLSPATTALKRIESVVAQVRASLSTVRKELPTDRALNETEREQLSARCTQCLDVDLGAKLERAAARLRSAASAHSVAVEARAAIERLPESLVLARADTPAFRAASPDDVKTRRVALRREASDLVVRRLLPGVDEQVRAILTTVAATAGRLREATEIAAHAVSTHGADESEEVRGVLDAAFERALARLDEHLAALDEGIAAASRGIRQRAQTALEDLSRLADVKELSKGDGDGVLVRLQQRLERLVEPVVAQFKDVRRALGSAIERIGGSQISQDALRRVGGGELDAADIREYTERFRSAEVPPEYEKLFLLAPVREHRLFTAHEPQMRELLAAERDWLQGAPGSALLVGEHGSGRTSMLNLCELELSAPRLLRPEPLEWRREVGIMDALAIELGVKPRRQALIDALREAKTTVLIDDLEHWLTPDPRGLADLESFLDLVVSTRSDAYWMVSIEQNTLSLFEESVGVRQAFARIVSLEPLEPKQLAEAIESRHALSGRKVEYPGTVVGGLLARFQRADERELYFRVLSRVSQGNLSRAYAAWLRSLSFDDDGNVSPVIHRTLSITLPFVSRLPPTAVSMLVELSRFGPMEEQELSRFLHIGVPETRRQVHFLRAAGLIEPLGSGRRALRIHPAIRPLVLQGLEEMGVSA